MEKKLIGITASFEIPKSKVERDAMIAKKELDTPCQVWDGRSMSKGFCYQAPDKAELENGSTSLRMDRIVNSNNQIASCLNRCQESEKRG